MKSIILIFIISLPTFAQSPKPIDYGRFVMGSGMVVDELSSGSCKQCKEMGLNRPYRILLKGAVFSLTEYAKYKYKGRSTLFNIFQTSIGTIFVVIAIHNWKLK